MTTKKKSKSESTSTKMVPLVVHEGLTTIILATGNFMTHMSAPAVLEDKIKQAIIDITKEALLGKDPEATIKRLRKMPKNLDKRIVKWSNGGDTLDWGWVIDGTKLTAYTVYYEWKNWEDVTLPADIVAWMRECLGEGPYEPTLSAAIAEWLNS